MLGKLFCFIGIHNWQQGIWPASDHEWFSNNMQDMYTCKRCGATKLE